MVRLAQAASSEYFGIWGEPPNQRRTGATENNPGGNMDGELNVVPFYNGWEYVFRPKSEAVAEMIAWLMEGAVENGKYIGYSQNNGSFPREGVFDALAEMSDPDTRKIKVLVNCDCSSLTGACVYAAGKIEPDLSRPELRTMWTGSQRQILMSTGAFIKLTDPELLETGKGLRRGDILLKTGHTATVIESDDQEESFPVRLEGCAFSRIRKGPGVEYDTVCVLPGGTILEALGTAADTDGLVWYEVVYEGLKGYTSGTYAKALPKGSCSGNVWLRETPGTDGKQILVIPKGAVPFMTGRSQQALSGTVMRTWYECIYDGHLGWASGLYVKP